MSIAKGTKVRVKDNEAAVSQLDDEPLVDVRGKTGVVTGFKVAWNVVEMDDGTKSVVRGGGWLFTDNELEVL